MKKAIIAVALSIAAVSAFAQCPIGMPYGCTQGFNGKMVCGCGVR